MWITITKTTTSMMIMIMISTHNAQIYYLSCLQCERLTMITSSNGNIFRVTGHLCGEFTGDQWIPRTKAGDAELWWFLRSAPELTVELNMEHGQTGDLRRHRAHYDVAVMDVAATQLPRHLSDMNINTCERDSNGLAETMCLLPET